MFEVGAKEDRYDHKVLLAELRNEYLSYLSCGYDQCRYVVWIYARDYEGEIKGQRAKQRRWRDCVCEAGCDSRRWMLGPL